MGGDKFSVEQRSQRQLHKEQFLLKIAEVDATHKPFDQVAIQKAGAVDTDEGAIQDHRGGRGKVQS